ncbi:MAG: hypothetical protein KME43_11270 [Myxacorys chilensis ATA2-1-KO14]|jgi:radical SAM superfamily enzyme|nr:hypothetical protein [Myxacorys chilensis ATA2-1-KO14]
MNHSPSPASKCATNLLPAYTESKQLGLLIGSKPDLIVDRVPDNIALADNRYYIRYGSWFAGIQLTRDEAYTAIELIGRDRDSASIWSAIEQTIDGGAL